MQRSFVHGSEVNSARGALRVAIIDIGSASIRSVVVEVDARGARRVLGEDRAMTKLARALASTGLIAPEAMTLSLEAIVRFVVRARALSCSVIRAFATSAVREAKNGEEFASAVREATARVGHALDVEVVSAEEEGLLALRSAASRADVTAMRVAVADLGGGSLEIVLADRGEVRFNRSLPLGAVRLTDQFGGGDACSRESGPELEEHVQSVLADAVPAGTNVERLVASGGTLTSLAAMACAARSSGAGSVAPAESEWTVRQEEVAALLDRVRATPMGRRHEIAGLPRDRVEIIMAGLVVVREVMARLRVDSLLVNPAGLREGLLLKVIEEAQRSSIRSG